MANDETPLGDEQNGSASLALLPANAFEQRPVEWSAGTALTQSAESAPVDVMVYLHAFRRHWLLALSLGVLCAALIGPAVWFSVGDKYTASSYLRVAMQEKPIAFAVDGQGLVDRDRFEIYKNTQQQLVQSRFVTMAALRKPDVTKLPSVQEAQKAGDAVQWLWKYISTSFPGKAEIMEVSVSRTDPGEAVTLARAIVDAYLGEVVNAERELKRTRLSELDRAYVEKEQDIRSKREDLKKLAETLGTTDTETLNVKQKLALEVLSVYRQEMARSQFDLRKFQAELAAHQAVLKSIDAAEITDADLDISLQNDPVARQLFVELGWRKLDQLYTEGAVVAGARSHYADRYQQDLKMMQQQFDARKAELAEMVRQRKRSAVQMEVQRIEASVAVMTEQDQIAQKSIDEKQKEAESFGRSTVDIEMMRADIKNLDILLTGLATEREKLRVEIRSTPRVTLLQRADTPEVPANTTSRIALTMLATLVGLSCPVVAVTLWDTRVRRINSSTDVSKHLRLPVIGSMPLIPSRVIRRLGTPTKRYQTWHVRLTESVDGIAARVLRKAETEQCRVIMVSSAAGGEGKTTLATQLAMSLARAGRQTVLVDFDLRRPAFDEVFGLPLEPGVCEVLRQQNTVADVIQEVGTNNLAVVTAGRWDRSALASLSNGAAAALFKQLREANDFVVVDTSPILPVADARFVSQHVDSVVLSVFRDISESSKIEAACEILSAFGVQTVEAVVTGSNNHMYGEHMGYESTISA